VTSRKRKWGSAMIAGYILETVDGLLLQSKFFKVNPTRDVALVASAISAIRSFTSDVLSEPVEAMLTGGNQIVVACDEDIMLSVISGINMAMAKQLAKKFVKVFAKKLQKEDKNGFSCDSVLKKIETELTDFEAEIKQVNEKSSHISYI
jgi:hypothetical protein